ncbi:alpha-glucosidase [Catenuloplanes nepalensis]|uniref:Alpha-glucosidase n=1 Tax=Catenuloplanes nepalensis TaxID=587533 RepID=A0ABT9N401_9ACTN|nr:glycoside hydrolase family 13 protein [Catenuloplanes nepalensis]MDP9798285.1 alpha-glucosidase [Catenuloplanes nepalensis]
MSTWWRDAVIYQVYPRSFADGNGDGIGDLAGVRAHLDHLVDLGVDAIWFSPWYPSPQADAGYDVADYRNIEPIFGTLAEAEALIAEAHAHGLKIIIDIVPNHVSSAHPWFQAALASPDAPERELFWFRSGADRPTDWEGEFGGPTWTRTPDGAWYLHLFDKAQPDLNWNHPRVREEHLDILRFWLERGVDGFRVDSAALLVKDPSLPPVSPDAPHPFHDLDGVHEIYRSWRRLIDSYGGDRTLIGEVWLPSPERFARYLRPDEMHSAFNLEFLCSPWDATRLREIIDETIRVHEPLGAVATWVLSNHDVTRPVTRYGRSETGFSFAAKREGIPTDLRLGTVRARAAALLSLALPGAAYVYQGEELGLEEVEDIPPALRQDPMWHRSGHRDPGRDGCRVPLPWSDSEPPFGFGTGTPWLPQPRAWKDRTVAVQRADPASMLSLYRAALRLRRGLSGGLAWIDAAPDVLAFRRSSFACVANLSAVPVPVPFDGDVLLASGPLEDGLLPPDTTLWIAL